MKTLNIFFAIFFIAALTACRKNDNNTSATPKQLIYTGSNDALSEGRYDIQVLQTGSYTCFTGGNYLTLPNNQISSTNTDVYNLQTGAWNRFGLSVNRNSYAAAALNNKLLFGGGYSTVNSYSSLVDIFNLATGQITSGNLSEKRSHLAAVGAGNKILFAGGNINNKVFATVDIYNTQTGQWTIDTLSLARASVSAGAAGNKIVFAGGIAHNGTQGYYSNRADIYDVQTGQWIQATISQARYNMRVIAAGNKIFFTGGLGTVNVETVDIYDVQTNKWTIITLSGNTLYDVPACTNGSQVFFTSGNNFEYTKLHTYDLATNQVKTVPLPAPQRGSCMAVAEDKLLIAVGITTGTITSRVIVYDTKLGTFDNTTYNLPEKKLSASAATSGNKIFIAGGVWDGPNAANQREVINYKTVSVFELK